MRRLARGCISESYPLYGTFMSQFSQCIFEWDEQDLNLLIEAKKGELVQAGLPDLSPSAVRNSLTKEELSRYCRRRTRGHQETVEEIEALLLALFPSTDTLGVPLFKEEMKIIWEEQQQHISCLQDPPGVPLYTITGHVTKGGVKLPILRCARGSTSLESFHLHLASQDLYLVHQQVLWTIRHTYLMVSQGGTPFMQQQPSVPPPRPFGLLIQGCKKG